MRDPVLSLTIAPGHRVTPATIRLADGSVAGPRECHPLLTSATQRHVSWGHVTRGGLSPECNHGVESSPAPLEPAIGQDARRATVNF